MQPSSQDCLRVLERITTRSALTRYCTIARPSLPGLSRNGHRRHPGRSRPASAYRLLVSVDPGGRAASHRVLGYHLQVAILHQVVQRLRSLLLSIVYESMADLIVCRSSFSTASRACFTHLDIARHTTSVNTPMMAITIISSMSVKPASCLFILCTVSSLLSPRSTSRILCAVQRRTLGI